MKSRLFSMQFPSRAALFCAASLLSMSATSPLHADGLPAGYTQLPFIKANGNCQIRTGVVPNGTDKVEMEIRPAVVNATQTLWCSRTNSTERQFTTFLLNTSNGKMRFDRGDGTAGQVTSTTTLSAGTNFLVVADYAAGTGVATNLVSNTEAVRVTMANDENYTPASELGIFSCHNGLPSNGLGNYASYACYSFKLKDSAGNLRLDLVPAKRDADGELGLYDLVRSTFLTNTLTGVFTTGNMTITPSDPQWGKALATIVDDITIDAGDGATWPGAITVLAGGSLTTRGSLQVSGATTINAGGSLTVADGSAYFTFGQGYVKGNLTVAAGATLAMNRTEAFQGAATIVFHLYGTLDAQAYRQRIDGGQFFFHDGSRVIGAGDAYCGLYAYRASRVVFDGNVEIVPPVAIVNAYTLTAACCENARVAFKGGIKAYTASQKTGLFVQEAATAAEGNAAGTCANAYIDIGPCAYAGTYDFTGSISLLSNAKIALGTSVADYTVTTSGTELELVSDKATALANHATAQPVPAITTTTATVRLTGDGTVTLPTTAPAYAIEFAGPSLVIASDAPVALASGSSFSADTVVGVTDLAAGTAATLFTNAGSIDVSKLSAKPAHNGVIFGDAAAVLRDNGNVVVESFPAYVSYGWVEPYIAATALIWLDASDAANFEFKDNTFGYVTTWKDRSAYGRDATAYTVPVHDANWGTLTVTNGVPAYCMGDCNSGIDLQYTRMTTIRTVFWAMSIRQEQPAFFLGDNSTYHFHRGASGQYGYNNKNAIWKNGKIYCDGVLVTDNLNTVAPADRHVYSTVTAANCSSDRLTCDRNAGATTGSYQRHGGRELSELIAFPTALSDSDRNAIEDYLAAKWMGASPTAARADDTFIYKKDYVVDDHVGGGKNLDFEEGAAVAVVNPSSSDAMLATTGSVSIPAGYALPVAVDATSLVPGTYVVMQAASGITDLSQFDATATVGDGASASFSVVDGKLVMTVTATSSVASQTWRPASSADLGWNTSSENWLYDGGATGGFIPYVPAFIDGAETATGDITVSGTMTAGPITLTGANDYTFKGSGTIAGGDTVTLGGTGTITLDGPNFGGQDIAITNGQKVVLGFNAGANALGTDSGSSGGKVSVAAGSQLNLNDTGLAGAADPRSEATQLKTFVIAGDGADGRGAIVNDALDGRSSHGYQNSALRRVELADDATIGGADRIDLRARSGTAATATPGIYGPEKTLTIKNSVWLANWSQPIEVGAIVIPAGGMFLPVQMTEAMFDIPGGITLDGGTIDHYQNTYPTNMPFFVTANGGKFQSGGGASTVKGDVTVASGATLAMTGDQNVTYAGAFDAAGATVANSCTKATYFNGTSSGLAITQSAGTNYLQNVVSGDLAITQTAGINYLKSVVSGDVTVTKSAGDSYLRSGFSGTDVNFTQTGGNGGFYIDNGTAFVLDTLTFSASGGSLYGWTYNTDAEADVTGTVDFGSTAGANFFVLGSAGAKGLAIKAVGNTKQFGAGHSSARPGALRLKSGTNLTVSDLCTGCVSTPSRGQLVVESGATVTASRFINGYYAGVPAEVSTHRTDIYGTVTATGNGYITMDAPRGEVYIHEGGVLTTPTLYSMRRNNVAPWGYGTGCGVSDGRQWLLLDGGRLEMGSLSGKSMPGTTKIDLYNGTVANTKSFGATQGIAVFFGHDAAGGEVELNLKSGTYLNLNTALSGASSVTLTGSGYVGGTRSAVGGVYQGALLGKFTVATTGATTNDLRNASAFMGGLAVAAGAHASVGKYSEEHYPFALTITSSGCYAHGLFVTNDFSYPYVAADAWTYAHKYCASSARPYGNYAEWGLRSEFYVPAEKAGTWTFSGSYDDYLILQIDGETLCNIMYTNPIPCQVTLSEGWHRLTVATADNTGSAGASTKNNWKDGKAFGFIVGESASTDGNDYTAFKPGADLGDGLTLDVRPAVNACVWSYCTNKPATTTWLTLADSDASWSHIKCLDTVEYIHLTGENAAADTLKYFSGKLSKFEGWFKVEDGKEGDWEFKMAYDDFHRFTVDGTELITRKSSSSETVTGNATLTAGWHRWEAVIGDGSGAWGRRTYNGGYALSYKAPGESAHSRFDETNLKLAATLGDIAVLEPSGIYKELEIGAGATLTSSGTMAMPIFGTLKGTGTLAGSFAFAGTTNCWEVTGAVATSATLPAATFSDATAETFAGLKSVSVLFDARPRRRAYYLTGAIDGLTAADAPAAAVVVKDAAGSDYSANFALTVKDGRLALSNGKPFSGMIILVK